MNSDGGTAAMEQFVILGKTAKGKACVALIQQVTSNRKIFVFGELLAMDNLQALRGTEHEPHLALLEIFAYGTYRTYQEKRASLPELQPPQLHKLRQLTLVSLAHARESVPYSELFAELGIPEGNVRELEDLIIETIYGGLLSGRLDQRRGLLRVKGAVGRDVRAEDVPAMISKLQRWVANSEALLATFGQQMEEIHRGRAAVEEKRQAFQQEFERVKNLPNLNRLAAAAASAAVSAGAGAGGGFEPFDDEGDGFGGPARKYGGGGSGARAKRNRMRDSRHRNK